MMDVFRDSPDCEDALDTSQTGWNPNLHRLHPIMADAPFAAVGVAEQARCSEEEPAPAPHPQGCAGAVDVAQHGFDLVRIGIEVREPVERGPLVMRAAPAPFLLDLQQVGILPDQMMARHDAAGEEMLRDPVLGVGAVEQICPGTMAEDMHEETAAGLEP